MTTNDTDTIAGNAPTADPGNGLEQPDANGVICQATTAEIGVGTDDDPFDATFLVAGTDDEGREVAVWIRLTPTTITNLTEQLGQVLLAQQESLGISGDHNTARPGDGPDASHDDEDNAATGDGRIKRFFDPLGIRHFEDRSARTTAVLGAAIASLVLLAFILQMVRG